MRQRPTALVPLLFGLLFIGLGCTKDESITSQATQPTPRPVSVLHLSEFDPTHSLQLTGSIESWAEQDISFDVSGFVEWMVESGSDLQGRWVDKERGVFVRGDVLARLDSSRYELRCKSVEAAIDVAKRKLRAVELAVEKVLPANLAAAEADLVRATEEYQRVKQAHAENAVSELQLIRRAADQSERRAKTEQVKATIEAQRAEVEAARARISELMQSLAAARLDVERCTLYAPFTGQVSKVYTHRGGYAAASTPVARLVMMDPLKIALAVSVATSDRMIVGDPVQVFLPGAREPVAGEVYDKSTVVDAATRTFHVSVLIRNEQVAGKLSRNSELLSRPRVSEIFRLERKQGNGALSPWMVEERSCLYRDEEGWFVWAITNLKAGERLDPKRPLLRLKKTPVTPGEQRVNYQGIYLYREIGNVESLDESSLIAAGVSGELSEQSEVLYAPERWRYSPGEIVRVLLPDYQPSPGMWVPMAALVQKSKDEAAVFVVDRGAARLVPVRLRGSVGTLWRIEALEAKEASLIVPGAQVIVKDIHFLVDGEPVKVVEVEEIKL